MKTITMVVAIMLLAACVTTRDYSQIKYAYLAQGKCLTKSFYLAEEYTGPYYKGHDDILKKEYLCLEEGQKNNKNTLTFDELLQIRETRSDATVLFVPPGYGLKMELRHIK